jgi:predicted nucleotidyltransferase component of viral defense system
LEQIEVFHLSFLRGLVRAVPPAAVILKGGTNLRFFFGSPRFSENMDFDAADVSVHTLRDETMKVLTSSPLLDTLRTFVVERVVPPNRSTATQTETVQRFKIHLVTTAGEDLSTKVEFSRRGIGEPVRVEGVAASVLSAYRMMPLVVPHYGAAAAARQKIRALISRRQTQARDVFDLYTLSTHPDLAGVDLRKGLSADEVATVADRIYSISRAQYRDTVVAFLSPDDRPTYGSAATWDEVRLRVLALVEHRER